MMGYFTCIVGSMSGASDERRPRWTLPAALPWRMALFALAFRIASALIAFLSNITFPHYQDQRFTMWGSPNAFWDTFVRYDAGWYLGIARSGYAYVAGGRSNIAFMPVYPLLMRYVGRLFGRSAGDLYLGGLFVSWLAFVLAAVAIYYLARLDLPRPAAERAVLLTTIFPFACFYGVVYTESLFLLLTVLAFFNFRARRWIAGGIAGGIASATRVNGILMLPALAWIAWRAARPEWRDRARAVFGLLLVVCGIAAYSAFVYRLTAGPAGSHNPFEWASTLQRWGYYPGGAPWPPLVRLVGNLLTRPYSYLTTEPMAPYDTLNGLAAIIFVASIPLVWRRFGAGYGLFMVANLWLPLSSGQYEGLGRYCVVLFPFFLWAATIRSGAAFALLVAAWAMLYALCLALFTTMYPLF
jgi:hypothetical protein